MHGQDEKNPIFLKINIFSDCYRLFSFYVSGLRGDLLAMVETVI
jgi:hypothetical protein